MLATTTISSCFLRLFNALPVGEVAKMSVALQDNVVLQPHLWLHFATTFQIYITKCLVRSSQTIYMNVRQWKYIRSILWISLWNAYSNTYLSNALKVWLTDLAPALSKTWKQTSILREGTWGSSAIKINAHVHLILPITCYISHQIQLVDTPDSLEY
jgi:hypothetical protein